MTYKLTIDVISKLGKQEYHQVSPNLSLDDIQTEIVKTLAYINPESRLGFTFPVYKVNITIEEEIPFIYYSP